MKIVALANAVTDSIVNVDEATLDALGYESGSWRHVDEATKDKLLRMFPKTQYKAGGSLANSVYALGCLGVDVVLVSAIANDAAGKLFAQGMHDVGVKTKITDFEDGAESHINLTMVTPDGQRTFANLPHTTRITPEIVDDFADDIIDADLLVIEGYLFIDQTDAVDRALELARENNVKIAITLAAEKVVIDNHDTIAEHIEDGIDLFIANEEELDALIDGAGHDEELEKCIAGTTRVVTQGSEGCEYFNPTDDIFIDMGTAALPGKLLDTNGAGDGFLGGFLSVYDATETPTDGIKTVIALLTGAAVAAEVICQTGPRLAQATYQKAAEKAAEPDIAFDE